MKSRQTYRIWINRICSGLVCLFCLLALVPFFAVVWSLLSHGLELFHTNLFDQLFLNYSDEMVRQVEETSVSANILYGMGGSLLIVIIGLIPAVPLGILFTLYVFENRFHGFASLIYYLGASISGIPSVIIGMIAYLWIVEPLNGFPALAGGLSLSIMMLPIISHYTLHVLNILPVGLKESAMALGASYTDTMLRIVLPSMKNGLFAGILMTVSRMIAQSVPLIIIVMGTSAIQGDKSLSHAALPVLIWNFFNCPDMIHRMWAASLTLFLMVLVLTVFAKCMSYPLQNKKRISL
ncbi:MAG: ABC transporter permease subunit [Candidatus Azobacteroides sp.]|nr:ABC transporter permease subunit [Candidatus Azobacteroides sp.]